MSPGASRASLCVLGQAAQDGRAAPEEGNGKLLLSIPYLENPAKGRHESKVTHDYYYNIIHNDDIRVVFCSGPEMNLATG